MSTPTQSSTTGARRTVVIVGRPNVGKSTLFNRFLGEQHAIVEDRPGVTRDRMTREVEWLGRHFDLVDTVGQRAGRLSMNAHLARLRAPLLTIAGSVDALAPPDSVHALYARAASPTKQFLEVDAGHIDLVVGDRAPALVWRPITRFLDDALQP